MTAKTAWLHVVVTMDCNAEAFRLTTPPLGMLSVKGDVKVRWTAVDAIAVFHYLTNNETMTEDLTLAADPSTWASEV